MGRSENEIRQEIEIALSETCVELRVSIQEVQNDQSALQLQEAFRILDQLNETRFCVLAENAESLKDKVRFLSSEIEGISRSLATSRKGSPKYGTNTFKCHSDFELCLKHTASVLEQTLCYALLARCIVKG